MRLPVGPRLTEDLADAIVNDIRRRSGLPSLTGEAAGFPDVTFRLPPDIRGRAAAIVEGEGKTIFQLAREAIEDRAEAS